MNRLGLTAGECADALRRYRERVAALRGVSFTADDPAGRVRLLDALDALLFELDVEIAAREGVDGPAWTSVVESDVFTPALARLRRHLQDVPPEQPGVVPARLAACQEALAEAERRARSWTPGRSGGCEAVAAVG